MNLTPTRTATGHPTHHVCPCCRRHLLTWDRPTRTLDLFSKVGLWADFWSGDVRLVCQYCLGTTEVLPDELVEFLVQRLVLPAPPKGDPRRPGSERWRDL